jgi:hypothetical protein
MGYTDLPKTEDKTDSPEIKDEIEGGKHSVVGIVITTIIAVFVVLGVIGAISNSTSSNSNQTPSVPSNPNQSVSSPAQPAPSISNVNPSQGNPSQITASDIAPYLTGVVEVLCKKTDANGVEQINDTGSGSLWSFPNGIYDVVTNEHVVAGDDRCIAWVPNPNGAQKGAYYLDLSNVKDWNSVADEAVVPLIMPSVYLGGTNPENVGINDVPLSQLNYSISSLQDCPTSMPPNSPVTIIGYPAFSSVNVQGNPEGAFKNQITTNGVISGNYSQPQNTLPYSNYYISATIDSGNSGGVALSKNADGVCLLGIPTWITLTGNFTNEGIVQNIHNVKYSQ